MRLNRGLLFLRACKHDDLIHICSLKTWSKGAEVEVSCSAAGFNFPGNHLMKIPALTAAACLPLFRDNGRARRAANITASLQSWIRLCKSHKESQIVLGPLLMSHVLVCDGQDVESLLTSPQSRLLPCRRGWPRSRRRSSSAAPPPDADEKKTALVSL